MDSFSRHCMKCICRLMDLSRKRKLWLLPQPIENKTLIRLCSGKRIACSFQRGAAATFWLFRDLYSLLWSLSVDLIPWSLLPYRISRLVKLLWLSMLSTWHTLKLLNLPELPKSKHDRTIILLMMTLFV